MFVLQLQHQSFTPQQTHRPPPPPKRKVRIAISSSSYSEIAPTSLCLLRGEAWEGTTNAWHPLSLVCPCTGGVPAREVERGLGSRPRVRTRFAICTRVSQAELFSSALRASRLTSSSRGHRPVPAASQVLGPDRVGPEVPTELIGMEPGGEVCSTSEDGRPPPPAANQRPP